MKKLKTLLFLLFTIPIYSQWVQQTSGTGENLNDVFCITEDVVVVVGDNGTILKTTDGGTNWLQKTSSTTYNLQKVQFVNQNVGYTLANDSSFYFGKLLKTLDGGETWNVILSFNSSGVNDLSVVSENVFYYTNDYILYKTIDGGATFQIVNTADFIQNIQFLNELIAYGLGGGGLVKTIDGGVTWNIIRNDVYMFHYLNENVGFFKDTNGLSKTIDGGNSLIYLTNINHTMEKIFASSENIIWGVTGVLLLNGQPNYITREEILDSGGFQRIDASDPILKSIYFANPTKGYGVAWGGEIYKNSTGNMLGLNEIKNKLLLRIYPNPSSEQVTISFNEKPTHPFSIEVADSMGKKVFSKFYNDENNVIITTKSMSKGIYFLTIVGQNEKQTQKLIIN